VTRTRALALLAAGMAIGGGAVALAGPHRPPPLPAAASRPARAAAWRDPSPHTARMVRTAPGVRLEVLDWGGDGPPLVLLAGSGNTAHVFDGFAPRFTRGFHVVGITRRGFGASCCPAGGYDSPTLAADVVAVLDSLGIARASFAAHSFGGSELNWLAVHAPERVERLVYLDAGVDFAELFAGPEWLNGPFPRPSFEGFRNVPADVTRWLRAFAGPGYPESEVRATSRVEPDGTLGATLRVDSADQKLRGGARRAEFKRIRAPVLAIYAAPRTAGEKYPWMAELDDEKRAVTERRFAVEERILARQRERFRREVPHVTVVEVAGGRHYIFLTHPGVVEERMRRFLSHR